ncbi:hypothetical protein [Flintibacter porci]|uniref:hypothetical protein n=1 Tax=Flintibacter porci TaxID=3342383 RepID=UPI003F8A4711
MKKNAIIYIDDTTAQVTKAFEKQARIFGTEEYKLWKAYREDFPAAKMVTKTIKKNPNKKSYKNLTYANMELFITEQNSELLVELRKQIKLSKVQSNPYRAVLAWFLSEFPKYDEYKEFWASIEAEDKNDTTAADEAVV